MSPIRITFAFFIFYAVTHHTQGQSAAVCETNFGRSGICVRLEWCPQAIRQIRRRRYPTLCGFYGGTPIVCCEVRENIITKSNEYGATAKQKCSEYIQAAAPTTTTTAAPRPGQFSNIAPFVVGGVDAFPLEFPHMAILGYGTEDDIQWKCGGSLISEKFILTAAHCIYTQLGQVSFATLGLHEISQITFNRQRFTIKNVYRHPEYIPNKRYNDIALIELDGEVNINAGVKPACLHVDGEIENEVLIATGWGAVEYAGETKDVLQKVNLTSISFESCSQTYQPQRGLESGLIQDIHLCATGIESRGDTCQGDSGGPLQVKIEGSKLYTVVGITSFGLKCGVVPAVYSRVSHYVPWIESIVWPANQ